jgi:LAGLIDADG endonuclease
MYYFLNKNKTALSLGQIIFLTGLINPGTKRTSNSLEIYFKKLNLNKNVISKSFLPLNYLTLLKNNLIKLNDELNIYFIIGLIEGDGSFYFGLRNNRKIRFGFNITTNIEELYLLYKIKFRLNFGIVKIKSTK